MRLSLLCSGVALGVYVPGLLLRRDLSARGVSADVFVLEELYPQEKHLTVARSKVAFHQNFRMAVAAHRMARDVTPHLEEAAVAALLDRWREEGRRSFVVLSGFWLPVLDAYEEMVPFPLQVELCHIDSVDSPSFRTHASRAVRRRSRRLLDAAAGQVPLSIWSTHAPPVPFAERPRRLLAHGGGWGMGTYAERAAELVQCHLELDVIVYQPEDVARRLPGCRYFMLEPGWHPWLRDASGEHTFPPFGEVAPGGEVVFHTPLEHHDSLSLARMSRGMLSKPGGGTLLDSLSAATPVILLEPLGEHERHNSELWERLGFGIGYERWKEGGGTLEQLEPLHARLMDARSRVGDYARVLAEELER